MRKRNIFTLMIALLATMVFIACGGGGGGGGGGVGPGGVADNDSDGIPNTEDAFPDDAALFANLAETTLEIFDPATTFSAAVAVNNSNQAIGTSNSASGVHAVLWSTVSGAVIELSPITGETYAAASDLNDNGDVAGVSSNNTGADFAAVVWAGGATTPTMLNNAMGGADSAAHSIDNNGRIVGEADDAGNAARAAIWTNSASPSVMLTDTLTSTSSSANYIEDSGFIAGEAVDASGAKHAVVWIVDAAGTQIGFVDLGIADTLGGTDAIASSVNASGRVVGEYEDNTGVAHAVEWQIDGAGALVSGPTDLADTLIESSGLAVNSAANARGAGWAEDGPTGNLTAVIADFRLVDTAQEIFDPNVVAFSQAYGIHDSDSVLGIKQTANGNEAFLVVAQ